MKIYYHEDKGVVIGSANFTNNGLNGGLKEAGVFIKNTKDIKIDRLIESLNANEVNDESLRQLYEGRDNLAASIPKRKGNNNTISHSFMGWYNSGGMRVRSWKAAWYEGNDNNNRRDDVGRQLRNWTYIADKNHLEVSNWVLTFNLGRNPGRFPVKWLFVQSIFKDDLNVENDYPFVAGQHNELGKIASNPPFELDNNFNRALREVVRAQDIGVLVNEDLTPRDELINNLWAALCVN